MKKFVVYVFIALCILTIISLVLLIGGFNFGILQSNITKTTGSGSGTENTETVEMNARTGSTYGSSLTNKTSTNNPTGTTTTTITSITRN